MSLHPERTAELESMRVRAFARDHFDLVSGTGDLTTVPFGACIRLGPWAVVANSSEDLASLGGVLLWAERHELSSVDLLVEHHAGIHARRAEVLAPEVRVWQIDGANIWPAVAAVVAPPSPVPDGVDDVMATIELAGAEVVVEDGIVRAELAGLEIGRVVEGPEGVVLEVGVGRFDREAGALLHAGTPTEPTLPNLIERLRDYRRAGAASHAINRIGRERWIRHMVMSEPSLAGVRSPELVEPIPARAGLLEATPASLLARDGGSRVLVVCSTGVDLGLVPATADLVLRHRPDEVRLVLPDRDRQPSVERLANRLPLAVTIIGVAPPWDDLGADSFMSLSGDS